MTRPREPAGNARDQDQEALPQDALRHLRPLWRDRLRTSTLSINTVSSQLEEEYESNSANIAKNIADSSVDILLNRNLATLQSLIDQFVEIQSIRYIYITSDTGEILTHTFVPGVPEVIRESDPHATEPVERSLPGMGTSSRSGARSWPARPARCTWGWTSTSCGSRSSAQRDSRSP